MYVYFIRAGKSGKGPIKIGVAKNIANRLDALQTGNHLELFLVGCIKCKSQAQAYSLEKMFHRVFSRFNIRNEWFKGSLDLKRVETMKLRESTKIEWIEEELEESEEFCANQLYSIRGLSDF